MAPTACLVVGGSGFLGQHIVKQLLDTQSYRVSVFDIRECGLPGVKCIVGDLRSPSDVLAAVQGQEVVIHVATATPTSENALNQELMDAINVKGLQHVIDACKAAGVTRLVYTSSASVVFDGRSLVGVNETAPYAKKPMDYYTATKIKGEQIALAANGPQLATCALRPSAIYGEGDQVLVPTAVRQAKRGKMKYIIGNGANKWDMTYVGNVAQAHVLAAGKLALGSPLAGQAYFITNQEPVPFWGFMGDLLEGLGYGRPRIKLPALLILFLAIVFEWVIRPLLKPIVEITSDFTVTRISLVTCERYFDPAKAKRDLGYKPAVSMAEGVRRMVAAFAHLRADAPPGGANGSAGKKAA